MTRRLLVVLLATVSVTATISALPALADGELSPPLGPVLSIAHRGASGAAPEHTFFAYDQAVRDDADFLECDLQLSRDGVLVCVHDTTVDRTSESSGRVDAFTLAELRQQDFGTWFNTANPTRARPEYAGARIVPFEEQLDCYRAVNPRLRFHVETKVDPAYGDRLETGLVSLLARKGLLDTGDIQRSRVLVQSFDLESLERSKRLAPTLPTMFLSAAPPTDQLDGSTPAYVDGVSPNNAFLLANPSYVAAAHARGKVVHTYTVNDAQTMDVLLQQGVDGIFTNEPAVLRQRIDARGTGVPKTERANPTSIAPLCPGVAGRVTSAAGPGDGVTPAPSATPSATPTATASPTPSATGTPTPTSAPSPSCAPARVELAQTVVTAPRPADLLVRSAPGTEVELLAYTQPSTTYAVVRRGVPGADGTAAFQVRPPASTRLYARQAGCTDGQADSRVLVVRTSLSLLLRRTGPKAYVFTGDALPTRGGGQLVSLYRVEAGGREVLAARARTDADGHWEIARTFTGSGRFGFVARTGADARNAAGASPVRTATLG